jgi:serine/threonine-protein kinase
VLYQCLTGNPAYEKDSEVALIYAHLLEPPPAATRVRPDLPPAIDAVIAKAMAKKPDDRYATARELATAVRSALTQPSAVPATAAAAAAPETISTPAVAAPVAAAPPGPPPTPPVAQEPAEAPAPAPRRAPGSGGQNRTRIAAAAAIVLVAIVAAVVAVIALTGGSSKNATTTASNPPPTTGSTSTTGTNTTTTKTTTTAAAAPVPLLAALLPTGIAAQCKTAATPRYDAVETEVCHPPANAPTSFPTEFSFSFFRSHAALRASYNALKDQLVVGHCGATVGQAAWHHLSTGKTGGIRICGNAQNGDSEIIWTHERLGNFDHVDMLGVASTPDRGANLFRSWWNAVKDDAGKCRPLLAENVCYATTQKFEKK